MSNTMYYFNYIALKNNYFIYSVIMTHFITSPLEQFEVVPFLSVSAPIIGDFNLSLTNLGLYAIITVFLLWVTIHILLYLAHGVFH